MATVVVSLGAPSEKIVDGRSRQVVPFVGTDCEGEFAQMGIGLKYSDDEGIVWGCAVPDVLIQSWRGMKILEQIRDIDDGTLCACWTIARRDVHTSDKYHLDVLAEQVGGVDALQALREEVFASVPSPDELSAMITLLRENDVEVDSWELEEEIAAGRLATSPLIETLIQETEMRRQTCQREEEEINSPLSPGESLNVFFADLGIANILDGPPLGAYDMDWGYIPVNELDQMVKRASFNKYLSGEFYLKHTIQGPETRVAQIGPGIEVNLTVFGEIKEPCYVTADGTKYTFLAAKWIEGRFLVCTVVDRLAATDSSPETSNLTIAQLRSMMGTIPPKPSPLKSSLWRSMLERISLMF